MGEHRVKNIASPISVYRVLVGDAPKRRSIKRRILVSVQQRRRAAVIGALLFGILGLLAFWLWHGPAPAGFPSVAVLPFENLTGDPGLAAYGDGVTEDLTTALSRFPDVTVLSRQVNNELKVDYLVKGSIQKKESTLRLNAQLIDAHTNAHVWAESYDGMNASNVQDDVIGRIANTLARQQGQIRRHEYKRTEGKTDADFGEYDYFLAGHEVVFRFASIEEHDRGGSIWQAGLKQFPDSALLRSSLAIYYLRRPWEYQTEKAAVDYRRAELYAEEALSGQSVPAPAQWRARYVMAYIHWFKGEFERAVADAEAAVALAPYDADTLSFMSRVQIASGNTNRALEWVENSIRSNPSLQRNTRMLAWIYYLTGEYEKSIEATKNHQLLSREFGGDASAYMVASYTRLGRFDDARAAVRRGREAEPRWSQLTERVDHFQRPYKNPAVAQQLLADLAAGGLPELPLDYDHTSEDRLSSDEIRTLTFGHTMRAEDVRTGRSFTDVINADGMLSTSGDFGADTGKLLYLGDSLICYLWNE